MPIKAIVFDACGTLFDVYSVGVLAEKPSPEKGAHLSNIWREKQIEYTRLRIAFSLASFGQSSQGPLTDASVKDVSKKSVTFLGLICLHDRFGQKKAQLTVAHHYSMQFLQYRTLGQPQ